MPVVRYSFTLDPILDADLVRWLALQGKMTEGVRAALRAYVQRPSHGDLERKLDRVLDVLRGVRVIAAGEDPQAGGEGEPARAVRGLGAMIDRFRGDG